MLISSRHHPSPGCYGIGSKPAVLQQGGDGLDLGVAVEYLVAHLAAPAGLLVSAERQGRIEHVVAVDPDGAGPELLGQRVGLGDIPGPDACAEAVLAVCSAGLRTTQLPVVSAGPSFHAAISSGKFHGMI